MMSGPHLCNLRPIACPYVRVVSTSLSDLPDGVCDRVGEHLWMRGPSVDAGKGVNVGDYLVYMGQRDRWRVYTESQMAETFTNWTGGDIVADVSSPPAATGA